MGGEKKTAHRALLYFLCRGPVINGELPLIGTNTYVNKHTQLGESAVEKKIRVILGEYQTHWNTQAQYDELSCQPAEYPSLTSDESRPRSTGYDKQTEP